MSNEFGVHSEVGKLRKVIVHRPGLEMRRLTPTNSQELLFDDVIWARKARQEHDAFVDLMRFEFGVDVTAVALTYGAQAGASTKGASASAGDTKGIGAWKRGMAVFTLAKGGLMYEASIGGQKFNFKPRKE